MAGRKVSAINIKKLWYKDVVDAAPTSAADAISGATEILNVHQDTWTIDESEPSQDSYRNQLTGMVYRRGTKTMGEVSFNFTIGQYDFALKAALMGGVATDTSWQRARGAVTINKTLVALTEDNVICVLTNADVSAREANTDGAVGIAVTGLAMEHEKDTISSEYWFDADSIYGAGAVTSGAQTQSAGSK